MDSANRGGIEEITGEIPLRNCVHRIVEYTGEPKLARRHVWVERESRACEGPGTECRLVGRGACRLESSSIPEESPSVGQQVKAEGHRLGPLEVGIAGHHRVLVFEGPARQHLDEFG